MYKVDSATRKKLYKTFGKTEEAAIEDVKTVRKWLEKQPHLPEIMNETMIRNILNLCKYNVEKAKKNIDNYYTYKTKYPELFRDNNPKLPHMKEVMDIIYVPIHPKLLDGLHRALFVKVKKPNSLRFPDVCKLFYNLLEIRLQDDFMTDDVAVIDGSTLTFRDICTVSFSLVYKVFNTYKNIFAFRLHALYFVNSPSYITILVTILKFVLPPKIFNRVKVCKDPEILKEIFPLEDLPKDYGGNGPSLDQLDAMMRVKFDEYQERFDLLDTLKVNEHLRPKKT